MKPGMAGGLNAKGLGVANASATGCGSGCGSDSDVSSSSCSACSFVAGFSSAAGLENVKAGLRDSGGITCSGFGAVHATLGGAPEYENVGVSVGVTMGLMKEKSGAAVDAVVVPLLLLPLFLLRLALGRRTFIRVHSSPSHQVRMEPLLSISAEYSPPKIWHVTVASLYVALPCLTFSSPSRRKMLTIPS